MDNQEMFLKEFEDEFKGHEDDYVLIKHGEEDGYSIFNFKRQTILLIDNAEMGEFFIKKLLDNGVRIYSNIKDTPGWGKIEREPPPDIYGFKKRRE